MKKIKWPLLIGLTVLLLAIIFLVLKFFYASPEPEESMPLDSGEEATMISDSDRQAFEAYLRANINDLSPEPAVLGGTFYITSITWPDDSSVIIEYEDGHVAFRAKLLLTLEASEATPVKILSFQIIEAL